jgi:aspartate carbamoyltransferase catalytic subunit
MTDTIRWTRKDLLGIAELSPAEIELILDTAESFREVGERPIKKVPTLRGKTVVNLFFEASTRTRSSFEIAEKRLSADNLNFSTSGSALEKGETLLDTALNLQAMAPDLIVIRHGHPGVPHMLAKRLKAGVINAGDGAHEHPTQALSSAFTILRHKGKFTGLKVAIIGDFKHTPGVLSNIHLLTKMGAKVTVGGLRTLMSVEIGKLGVDIAYTLEEAIRDADVIMMLRIPVEQQAMSFPSIKEYLHLFGLTTQRIRRAKDEVIVLHQSLSATGTSSEVVNSPHSITLEQVTHGVAIHMAVLYLLSSVHERP